MPLTPPAPRRQRPAPRRRKPAAATLGEVFSPAPSALTTPHPSVSSFPSQEGTVLVPSSRSLGSSAQRKHAGDPGAPPVRAHARLRAAELHHRGRRIRSRGAERSEVAPPTTGGPLRVWCCMVRFVRRPRSARRYWSRAAGRLRVLGIECVGVIAGSVNAALPAAPRWRPSWARWEFDGGYAEYALLPDELLIPVGSSLDWPVLGALPETYLTAWGAMQALGIRGDGHGGRAERHDLRAVARAADTLPTRSGSAISAAERIDIGHGPDKYVPVDSAVPWQTRAWSSGSACPGVSEGADLGGAVLPGDIRDVQCVAHPLARNPARPTGDTRYPPFGAASGPSGGHRLSVQMWLIWRLPASRRKACGGWPAGYPTGLARRSVASESCGQEAAPVPAPGNLGHAGPASRQSVAGRQRRLLSAFGP